MNKKEKKKEMLNMLQFLKHKSYILEIISKISNYLCSIFAVSALTCIVISTSSGDSSLSMVAFGLLVFCIASYFIRNVIRNYIPMLEKNIDFINEYYDQCYKEEETKNSK